MIGQAETPECPPRASSSWFPTKKILRQSEIRLGSKANAHIFVCDKLEPKARDVALFKFLKAVRVHVQQTFLFIAVPGKPPAPYGPLGDSEFPNYSNSVGRDKDEWRFPD